MNFNPISLIKHILKVNSDLCLSKTYFFLCSFSLFFLPISLYIYFFHYISIFSVSLSLFLPISFPNSPSFSVSLSLSLSSLSILNLNHICLLNGFQLSSFSHLIYLLQNNYQKNDKPKITKFILNLYIQLLCKNAYIIVVLHILQRSFFIFRICPSVSQKKK